MTLQAATGEHRGLGGRFAAVILPLTLVAAFGVQVFLATRMGGQEAVLGWGGLSSDALRQGRWWTLFTSMFLHQGLTHLFMNASVALIVAAPVALALGRGVMAFVKFVALYLICGLAADFTFVAMHLHDATFAVGASGALSGLWGAMTRIPMRPGPLYPPWSPNVLRLAAPFVLINIVLMGALSAGGVLPIAWEAHLGGFVSGFLLIGLFAVKREPAPETTD